MLLFDKYTHLEIKVLFIFIFVPSVLNDFIVYVHENTESLLFGKFIIQIKYVFAGKIPGLS